MEITKAMHPQLFMRTNKGVCRPTPQSYSDRPQKAAIPIRAPDYNKFACLLPSCHAADLHAMLFALHSNFDKGTAPITSDDMLVVLDSGCTCAITFDKDDFVGQIRPVQNVELQDLL
jgi:hypothetical protein